MREEEEELRGPGGLASGGTGATSGGTGQTGNRMGAPCTDVQTLRQEGAGGGGCPLAVPGTCAFTSGSDSEGKLILGSAAAAGASGGCASDAGGGGRGGTARGYPTPHCSTGAAVQGGAGGAGGGIIFILAEQVVLPSGASTMSLKVSGQAGGKGGSGETMSLEAIVANDKLGYAGGGGAAGSQGASGGTVVLVGETVVGTSPLQVQTSGGPGGAGGNGGNGVCVQCPGGSPPCSIIETTEAGLGQTDANTAATGGKNATVPNCGGQGGGGKMGAVGMAGRLYQAGVGELPTLGYESGNERKARVTKDLEFFRCPSQ